MLLKYRGIAYEPEYQSAIAQSQQELRFLGQPYSAPVPVCLYPKRPKVYRDRLQFLGQRYPRPSLL